MLIVPISLPPASELPVAVVAVIAFGPILLGLGIYFYATRHRRLWKRGIFPPKLKFTQDNLLEAYLAQCGRHFRVFDGRLVSGAQFLEYRRRHACW